MKKKMIVFGSLFCLFCFILGLVLFSQSHLIDYPISSFIFRMRCDFFDHFFKVVTKFGNTVWVVVVVFFFLLVFRNQYGITLGSSACICLLSNLLLKKVIRRDRPDGFRLISQGGYSFPSGHAMISVCIYGYLVYLVFTKIKNPYLKYSLAIFLLFLILSIGISRIYVGVHYPTDILAGYLLGLMELLIVIDVSDLVYHRGDGDV